MEDSIIPVIIKLSVFQNFILFYKYFQRIIPLYENVLLKLEWLRPFIPLCEKIKYEYYHIRNWGRV